MKNLKQFALIAGKLGVAAAFGLGLAACSVGPDFKTPELPAAAKDNPYTPTPVPPQTAATDGAAGVAQHYAPGQDIPQLWWSAFHSAALDRLIRAALAQNPNLAAAEAALRQATENYSAQRASLLVPDVSGQLGASRQRATAQSSGIPGGAVYSLYNASVNVSYTFDVFGASRRTLEGYAAAVDYQRFQLEATYLALTTNLVTTAIQEASLRAQLQATREVIGLLKKQLYVIEKQYEFGAIARATLLTQRNQLAQAAAALPPLEKALAQTRHQLSVFAGKFPGEPGMPEFQLASLQLPQQLPLSLPSALVRQRPDIRASEALLHEASAQIGVASANLYPQFKLSADYGSASTGLRDLFGSGSVLWGLTAGLTQPIFDGGALSARRRAALAAYEQAGAQYQATLLIAFQNVADSLRALDSDATTLKAQAEVDSLAAESLALVTRQYGLGAVSYLALLDAQRTYQQAHVSLVQAQAARYADTAALFQALGGGWWNRAAAPDRALKN